MIDVLLVEDEIKLAHVVKTSLESEKFRVRHFPNAIRALDSFTQTKPDIIVLDITMPEMDGFALASKIRERDTSTPMIFLTARTSTEDLLRGFQVGGNDYVKKPFVIEELIARITSLTTPKRKVNQTSCIKIGRYLLNPERQLLKFEDEIIRLSYRQSELLKMLYENRNSVLPRETVAAKFKGNGQSMTHRSLDVFVCRLRKYLIKDTEIQIKNVRGIGYKMII